LTDQVRMARAAVGSADTVVFSVRALYAVNGNLSNWATVTKIVTNADLRVPSIPVIVTVDTL
jgi:hypothetical protein